MLMALSIRDFVSIERLDLEPGYGFTALTGETGAGKSILLEALGVALGDTPQRRFVRTGQSDASVCAEFSIGATHPAFDRLEAAGLVIDRAETLRLRRLIRVEGPSRGFINDQSVSAALLAEIGETLVEVHGQHANTGLLRPSSHRELLDAYGGNEACLGETRDHWAHWRTAIAAREELEAKLEAARSDRAFLEQSLSELDALAPEPDELDTLDGERQTLMAVRRIGSVLEEARAALGKSLENGMDTAARALSRAQRALSPDDLLMERLDAFSEGLERALIESQDVAAGLDAILSDMGDSALRLETIESRLFSLKGAARKHQCLPGELSALRARLSAALQALDTGEDELDAARKAERDAEALFHASAAQLTAARTAAALRLGEAVMAELAALHLANARFRVDVGPATEPGPLGVDTIVFEIATSPAAVFGPLKDIASGGELARFSLALKVALSEVGDAGTLIFDEVDQGVGGAVATAIGERLSRLARSRQVLVVTHSPQVAACGFAHWRIEKRFEQGLGRTAVSVLDETSRADEIARMLSGREITGEARAAARSLLDHDLSRQDAQRPAA